MGMKQILVMMAAVVLVGCSKDTPETSQAVEAEAQVIRAPSPERDPVSTVNEKLIADPIVLSAVHNSIEKHVGKLNEKDLENVTDLKLIDTQITDAGLKDVAKLHNLERLNLINTGVTDTGLKEVAKLEKLNSLNLKFTQITDAGLKDVAKLQKLEVLYLNNTQITKTGVAELRKALPNCEIEGP